MAKERDTKENYIKEWSEYTSHAINTLFLHTDCTMGGLERKKEIQRQIEVLINDAADAIYRGENE